MIRLAKADAAEQNRVIDELIANRKVTRRKAAKRPKQACLVVPVDPISSTAQTLLDHLGVEGAKELNAELGKLLECGDSSPLSSLECGDSSPLSSFVFCLN